MKKIERTDRIWEALSCLCVEVGAEKITLTEREDLRIIMVGIKREREIMNYLNTQNHRKEAACGGSL